MYAQCIYIGTAIYTPSWIILVGHQKSGFLTHRWEPYQAEHAAWPLLTQKLKYNSTKTGQDDETESRKTSKKEYIISNWF